MAEVRRRGESRENHITPNPFFVEFTSILERTLVFATTGSGRVLHRSTMMPTLLAKGLMSTGYPALSHKLYSRPTPDAGYGVVAGYWPEITVNGYPQPASSTFNGLRFHYNEDLAFASFTINYKYRY